jgi:hypothetical protein
VAVHGWWWVAAILMVGILLPVGVLLAVPPFAQPQWYHQLADQRSCCGITHAANVLSNIPFVVIGLWGVWWLSEPERCRARLQPGTRWPYAAFFAALAFTGLGSAWYHWAPDNQRLLWDRLPLAVAFMVLVSILVWERIGHRAGRLLLVPLVLLGAGSVLYWHFSELADRGDLRPYLLVQIVPLLLLPPMLLGCASPFTRSGDLWAALLWYVAAKACEALDRQIYVLGQVVSGHTLKHLAAAVSAYMILHTIQRRTAKPE